MKTFFLFTYILGFCLLQCPVVSSQDQILLWPNGEGFMTFGPNSEIIIDLGTIKYINNCDDPGINDFIYPSANIYIISDSLYLEIGDSLSDVSGSPNTIQSASDGTFILETIGFTSPGGTIGSGLYSVVYDECQDGVFDEEDMIFAAAFEVIIPVDVPPIDPAIMKVKIRADSLRKSWEKVLFGFEGLLKVVDKSDAPLTLNDFTEGFFDAIGKGFDVVFIDPREGLRIHLKNTITHYKAIHADPPDPNFLQITYLDTTEVIDLLRNDLLLQSFAKLASSASIEEVISLALLKSIERYKGAEIANDAYWALIHAKAVKKYGGLLKDRLSITNSAFSNLYAGLLNDARPFDQIIQEFEDFRLRVESIGFTDEESAFASNLGLTTIQLSEIRDSVVASDFSGFSKNGFLQTIAIIQYQNNSLKVDLDSMIFDMNEIINYLNDDPQTLDNLPSANAGGPYTGTEGSVIFFDCSLSSSPSAIVSYGWDFNGDSQFDDGAGTNPSYTFNQAFCGLVGIKVTNEEGLSNINYSVVEISNINNPPQVVDFTPAPRKVIMDAGTSQTFSMTAYDLEGDDIIIEWHIDSNLVSTGSDFTFIPNMSDVGVHAIEAKVSDNNPLGGSIIVSWITFVLFPDVDGDGWRSHVDCNDANPEVFPDAIEICDQLDNNCNGQIDEGFDVDADGVASCDGDCDDTNPNVFPGATELCDNLDNDCNGNIDEGISLDGDGDGYSFCQNDCNDNNASIYPGAIEICNGLDDDCDGQVDEGNVCCPASGILYVSATSTGLNTGQTWADAFRDLQPAIDSACNCPNIPEIWVAQGTYKPTALHGGGSNRHKTFFIDCDVRIYGGFLGTETNLAERNWQTNLTTLSGELGMINDDSDNSYHVVWIDHVSSAMRLDGIRITAGNADGPWQTIPFPAEKGGGIFNDGSFSGISNPTIVNCTFYRNMAHLNGSGGGMFNYGYSGGTASPTLINCLFSENSGGWGGGMYNFSNAGYASPTLINCAFEGNYTGYSRYGGAIVNHSTGMVGACSPIITDCKFIGNWANSNNAGAVFNVSEGGATNPVFTNCIFLRNSVFNGGRGGAVVNESGFNGTNGTVAPVFSNCIFSGNYADQQAGAVRNAKGNGPGICNPTFLNCSFSGNKADNGPGAIWNSVSSFNLVNCILWGNSSEISNINGGQATVTYSIVQGGFPGTGNMNQNPQFVIQPDFNNPFNSPQDLRLQITSPAIDNGNDAANSTTTDLDGNPRKVDAVIGGSLIDMGAYEHPICYADIDGDSYGDPNLPGVCETGYVSDKTDCNDGNAFIHPGAEEVCNGLDDDCDGQTDEGVLLTFYADSDGDGYGNPSSIILACLLPNGYVSDNSDCNDNCAGCHPGATEICDGLDNDCDGQTDEGVLLTFYADGDGDGYGNAAVTTQACSAPGGYVSDNTDCNDSNAAIHPGATEICNGLDDDCDGQTDEGVLLTFYADSDGDGYGNAAVTTQACSAPNGYVSNNTDCDDSNAGIYPGASETCNGMDDDCDGQTDEGVLLTFYADGDGDGYGNAAVTTQACSAPGGYVSDNTDCNDSNAAIHPGATEICNGLDDDCDGQTDEGVLLTFYADSDGDGYGNAAVTTQACSAPGGYISDNTDCDDTNAYVNPSATEVCNGFDDNCDGLVDDADPNVNGQITWYADGDGDGYGNPGVYQVSCDQPVGYVANNNDCNDANGAINPGMTEACNGIDDDCDGLTDEGCANPLNVDAGTCQVVYYGYAPLSCTTLIAVATGGVPPYSYAWSNGVAGAGIQVCPGTSQTYTVTVTDANGNTASDGVNVEVVDVRCGNNNSKVLVCHNGSNTLCISPNAVPAHLDHGDQLGTCGSEPCSSENGSKPGSTTGAFHAETSGIRMTCYPNPAGAEINVLVEGEVTGESIFEIADFTGKTVRRVEVQAKPGELTPLDLSGLPSGTYLLRWSADGKMLEAKSFVIIRE